jgi:hypothetical protein
MPRNNFDDPLPVLRPNHHDGEGGPARRLGVCAMGPVAPGETLISVQAWVFQTAGTKVVAASGTGGKHVRGAHPLAKEDRPPFQGRWMAQTALEKGSDQFVKGKPALAVAMAIVERGDGSRDIEYWTQAVAVR